MAAPSPSPPALPGSNAVWRAEVAETTTRLEDAATLLFERNKRAKLNLSTEAKDAEIRELLRDARLGIGRLEGMLSEAEETGSGNPRDLKSWEDSLINLTRQFERIEIVALESKAVPADGGRDELLAVPTRRSHAGPSTASILHENRNENPEDALDGGADPYADKSDPELLQLQKRIMDDQDASLDALVGIIERQKQIGVEINRELDYHIELLEDTEDRVDRTTGRLEAAGKRLDVVRKTVGSNWGLCTTLCLIVLLLIVLVFIKILR